MIGLLKRVLLKNRLEKYSRGTIQQYVDGGFATHQLDINEVEGIIRPLQQQETLKEPTGVKASES